ncbi:GMC oxidoreductase [Myriangium duriaei CBS 260.36]|uniref:GMC oxidoreductase n=1 Tax=Myriangium duriaei CBS 260.36 TaxID=1168546 RepID=A0A9P4IXU3_9PEZI|nr:GMC oxidoreductase [Myriangium duriaei CBS 260.36]
MLATFVWTTLLFSLLGSYAAYDYVIVGGGTGGLAIAARLASNPAITVAVIEAGGLYEVTSPVLASTPGGDVLFCGSDITDNNPLVDWSFVTQPQAGANQRKLHFARGKCLGGSSARNFMIYQRPTKDSMQQWADAVGDQSWNWDNSFQYFQKSCKFTPPNTGKRAANASAAYNAEAFSAAGGPLDVSYANYAQTFSSWMEESFNEIGIPTTEDFNSGSLMGCQYCSSTITPANENRASSQTTFLNSVSGNTNIKIYQATLANRILFNSANKATGVQVSAAGLIPFTIFARKEVILSAGAFQSPQLLMVSGIGPAAQLKALDIPVIADRPGVGQNMTDHIFFGPAYRVTVDTFTKLANDLAYVLAEFATDYTLNQAGPLTNPVADFLGWEKVPAALRQGFSPSTQADLATYPEMWPELEYISAPGYVGNFGDLFLTQPKDGYQYATILATLVAPKSRGNVTITSASTAVLPQINPNWLTSNTDQQVAVAGYKRVRQAFASKAMSNIRIGAEYFPGPAVQTDEQILDTIRDTLMTVWHPSVTCRMGRADDPNAVVDSKARVIGVSGLRVVDASSFALLPPGHPQSTIYMMAEKVAADILGGL